MNEPGARIRPGMRVVYADRLHGTVLMMRPEAYQALLRLDNGTTEWFRSDLMVPEGEHDPQEQTPGAWRDRAGFLWLEAAEPGSRRVFCYDAPARRRMGDKWPTMALDDAEREFGPMEPMVPVPPGEENRIVFLYGGGCPVEVPPAYGAAREWEHTSVTFTEVIPGWSMAMVARGHFWVNDDECVDGVFVVIRRTA